MWQWIRLCQSTFFRNPNHTIWNYYCDTNKRWLEHFGRHTELKRRSLFFSVLRDLPDKCPGKLKFHWFACHWGESNFTMHSFNVICDAFRWTIDNLPGKASAGKWKINTAYSLCSEHYNQIIISTENVCFSKYVCL